MSQLSSCNSLKPTARWWFSSTDSSLYMSASSESAAQAGSGVRGREDPQGCLHPDRPQPLRGSLTGVDEELVGDPRVVHVVDGSRKKGCENLQVCEYSLEAERGGQKDTGVRLGVHRDRVREMGV